MGLLMNKNIWSYWSKTILRRLTYIGNKRRLFHTSF